MKKLILAALVAASVVSPASAWTYDNWNNSGMSLNHRYYGRSFGSTSGVILAPEATQAEIDKAHRDQRTCAPVVLWTDDGRVVQPAMGCRR